MRFLDVVVEQPKVIDTFHRTGCMAAFESFQQFEQYADEIFDLIEDFSSPASISARDLNAVESGSESRGNSTSINVSLSLEARRYVENDRLMFSLMINRLFVGRVWTSASSGNRSTSSTSV